jgi:uncharacterized OsmC-like protein
MAQTNKPDLKDIVSRRIDFFRRKPEAAIYRPRVSSTHIKNLYTETRVRDHIVKADYAEPAGGDNRAPNPIELLLSAFAACIESAFYEFALYEGFTVTSLSVDVEGTLDLRGLFMIDDSIPAGFTDVRYSFTIESPDDEDKLRDLAERVVFHCPVVDSLVRRLPVSGEVTISKQ